MRKQHAPVNDPEVDTKLHAFSEQKLSSDQLLQLKGGDGDEPPAEEGIGHEDVIDM